RRDSSASARSRRGPCPRVRARRSSCSSSERKTLGAESDPQLVALGAHIHDLREVDPNRPLLALDIVPAVGPELLVESRELDVDVPQPVGDMMEPRAVPGQVPADRGLGREASEQLHVALAKVQEQRLYPLLLQHLAIGDRQTEAVAVELERRLDLLDGYA